MGVGPRNQPMPSLAAPKTRNVPVFSSPQAAIDAKMIDEGCTDRAMAASEAARKKCEAFKARLQKQLRDADRHVSSPMNGVQLNKHHLVGMAATLVLGSLLLWRFCSTRPKATFDEALLEEI